MVLYFLIHRWTHREPQIWWEIMNEDSVVDTPFSTRQRIGFTALGAIGLAGVALQFAQGEDLRFPLWYFTVNSAIGTSALAFAQAIVGRRTWGGWATSFFSASVVSGVVYWIAIFPTMGAGVEPLTIAANIVLHAALPIVVLATQRGTRLFPQGTRLWLCLAWPFLYCVAGSLASLVFEGEIPYDFITPSVVGIPMTVVALAVVSASLVGTTLGLRRLQWGRGFK